MSKTLEPKVYVGTYAKYNEGSIKGGWVTLTDYKCYADFMKACFNLHKDERDPELMIQDVDDMPDGLSVMESISEQEYNDIIEAVAAEAILDGAPQFQIVDYSEKAVAVVGDTRDIKDKLKELGGRFNPRLSCGAGWIFSKKQQADLEKLLQGGNVEKSIYTQKTKDDNSELYKKALEEYISDKSDADKDYYRKYCIGAVKLNDGYYLMDKPTIETKFCFHDEGPDYEFYKELMADDKKMKDYFIYKNLRNIDIRIEQLQSMRPMIITSSWSDNRKSYEEENYRYKRESDVRMTEEQRKELIKAIEWKRAMFEKRLQAYLKRYGLTKIHTWTYWADR